MPILKSLDYKPAFWARHAHFNTIYPYLFRKKLKLPYQRERFILSDGDFIDLDLLKSENSRIAIICHGLEGSSDSQYMTYMSKLFSQKGWDVCCMNFRSCSGEMNTKLPMYHSGATADVHEVVSSFNSKYAEICLIGYSLGGNVVLKYTCDNHYILPSNLKSTVGVSVPCDLSGGARQISHWYNKAYDTRFLKTLKEKMVLKYQDFPDEIDIEKLKLVDKLWEFDEYFTGPIHGFKDAEDYYRQCNSLQFLDSVKVPTLLISALDDPFLPKSCYPFDLAKASKNLFFLAPKFGGHVGFTTFGSQNYWNEYKIQSFANDPVNFVGQHDTVNS